MRSAQNCEAVNGHPQLISLDLQEPSCRPFTRHSVSCSVDEDLLLVRRVEVALRTSLISSIFALNWSSRRLDLAASRRFSCGEGLLFPLTSFSIHPGIAPEDFYKERKSRRKTEREDESENRPEERNPPTLFFLFLVRMAVKKVRKKKSEDGRGRKERVGAGYHNSCVS